MYEGRIVFSQLLDFLPKKVFAHALKDIMAITKMVLMPMLFMLEQRLLFKDDYPLLSCFDIVCILVLVAR